MLDRIADYLAERRDFLANSAHELRSPVAAIRSTAEVALGSQRSKEEYETLLWDIVEECESLEVLVNQLLLLAETENLSIRLQGELVNLSTVVERACDMFQAAADARGVSLQVQSQPEVIVEGHEHHLRQVLNNLIDNALKFTPEGREVLVELRARTARLFSSYRIPALGFRRPICPASSSGSFAGTVPTPAIRSREAPALV